MINGIRSDCMNKWMIISLDISNDVTTSFWFYPTDLRFINDRFLGGYINLSDYKPTECKTQQNQLIIRCFNTWVAMYPTGGGGFWFWPSKADANPSLVWGWLYLTDNMNTACNVVPSSAAFNIAGTWKTDYGNMVFVQTGTNVTGTYPNGRVTGTLNYNQGKGKWELNGNWFEGIRTGRILFTFENANEFKGIYGYDTAEPNPGSTWNGTRIS